MRGELPLIFKPPSLQACDVRVVASVEHMLTLRLSDISITVREDDSRYAKCLKEILVTAFEDTGMTCPLRTNQHAGLIAGKDLVIFSREIDMSFNFHSPELREALSTSITQRRNSDAQIVRNCCGVPPDPEMGLLDFSRRQRSIQCKQAEDTSSSTPSSRQANPHSCTHPHSFTRHVIFL